MPHTQKHDEEHAEEADHIIDETSSPVTESDSTDATPEATEAKTDTELAAEYLTDLKRLQAEFENYKKRQANREKEMGGYLIEKLLLDVIPVMDNFRMATEHVPEAERASPWVVGIQYIEKQLEKVLTENGVTAIEAKVGDMFDPSIHEALTDNSKPIPDNQEEENKETTETANTALTIEKVLQNGYKIGERVIRPAKVTVK